MAGIWGILSGLAAYDLSLSSVWVRSVNLWISGGIFQRESGKYGGNSRFARCRIDLKSFVNLTIEDNTLGLRTQKLRFQVLNRHQSPFPDLYSSQSFGRSTIGLANHR